MWFGDFVPLRCRRDDLGHVVIIYPTGDEGSTKLRHLERFAPGRVLLICIKGEVCQPPRTARSDDSRKLRSVLPLFNPVLVQRGVCI